MRPQNIYPPIHAMPRRSKQDGFALVIALGLMAFVLLLLLSITTFVAVESKNAATSKERLKAEQNALLAAMQAIGQLQRELGPDQRVTATAGVLELYADVDGNGVADSTLVHSQWLGSWNAWDSWLTDADSDGHTLASTYTQARANKFNRWLVSHPDPEELEGLTVPASNLSAGIALVELVGENTLGASADASLQVEVPRVELNDDSGGYAWWVGGENQKASVDASELPNNPFEALSRRSQRTHSGAEKLDGLSSLTTTAGALDKVSDFLSIGLLGDTTAQSRLPEYAHDLTVESAGVLANVRDGGLKQDLNLLLENDTLPAAFGTEDFLALDKAGTIRSIRPYTADVPQGVFSNQYFIDYGDVPRKPNFTSWYKLHQYYSLYKNTANASGQLPLHGSNQPTIDFHQPKDTIYSPYGFYLGYGYEVMPVVSRSMVVLSTRMREVLNGAVSYDPKKYEYLLHMTPLLCVWNPYNVTIEVEKIVYDFAPSSLECRIYNEGALEVDWTTVNLSTGANTGIYNTSKYNMRLSENGIDQSQPMILKPGESRIYGTFSSAGGGYYIQGYTGPLDGGGVSIPIRDGDIDVGTGSINDGLIIDADVLGNLPEMSLSMRYNGTNLEYAGLQYWMKTRDYGVYSSFNGQWVPDSTEMPIIPDVPGDRVIFPVVEDLNEPFASLDFILKSGEQLVSPDIISGGQPIVSPDYRCKSFIHANPANARIAQGKATDRAKAMAQYQVNVRAGSGNTLNPDFETSTNAAYIGSAVSNLSDYTPQANVTAVELPVVPVTSLASLMHFQLTPGIVGGGDNKGSELYDMTPNQALALGNSFAHPLVPADAAYSELPEFTYGTQFDQYSRDAYDHAFFNNDALWDNWFCSGLTRQETGVGYFDESRSIQDVADDFIAGTAPLANTQLRLWKSGLTDNEVKTNLINGAQPAPESWSKAASHLMLDGAFNVNSTSVAAWQAFLWGLRDTELNYVDPETGDIQQAAVPGDRVVLSRFTLPASAGEGADAGDSDSWLGIRLLTENQVSKLAEECVRQVKLRGPFLNMADFVNRRLEDSELGQVGALQAAIDWDEWNGHSPSAGANDSINGRFKNPVDLITDADVSFSVNGDLPGGNPALPNPEAATGSRWTGIPGYVTQADLLKRIGNQITVRDDTFRIRAYGDTKDLSGKVVARVWCEVVVQRVPDYVASLPDDGSNTETDAAGDLAREPVQVQDTSSTLYRLIANPDLLAINQQFGRRFVIKSFRWLNVDEI